MALSWSDDPRIFAAADWAALCRADPEATVFHSPGYLKLYWEEFGHGRLQLAAVGDEEEPLARVAFEIQDGLCRFLGGTEVTDYMGPVGAPEHRGPAAKELLSGLAARDDWAVADLRGLPEDGSWLGALREAAGEAGLDHQVEEDGVAPQIVLPGSYDAYLAGLSSKRRHEIRRKGRRLREALPGARTIDAAPNTLARDLGRFVELHRTSSGPKGKFMQPGMELFFRRLGEELLPDGLFRLAFLEAGGERVAGVVAFRWRDSLLLYNSAYDHRRRSLAPGMVLVAEVIRGAIEDGCRRVDMLTGDLEYKYRFGATPRRVSRLLLRRT